MPPLNSQCIYLGIDPGTSGGLASLRGKEASRVQKLEGMTERDVWDWFFQFVNTPSPHVFATIEAVHSMPGDGHVGAFKFGVSYGGLRMALIAAGIPFEEVSPQKWTKEFVTHRVKGKKCEICQGKGWVVSMLEDTTCKHCNGKKKLGGEDKNTWKNRLKAKAQQLFPSEKVTLATADALLLAEYGRRKMEGKL